MNRQSIRPMAAALATAFLLIPGDFSKARSSEQTRQVASSDRSLPSTTDLAERDLSIRPGDDFWRHANNDWLRRNPIPPELAGFSNANVIDQVIARRLLARLTDPGSDPVERQLAKFFDSWMDITGIERRGLAPARPYLDQIANVRDRADLVELFPLPVHATPVSIEIIADPDNPARHVVLVAQSGLGMPSREHYLQEGARYQEQRAAYRIYLTTLFRLAGLTRSEERADAVIALERRIADAHWDAERSDDWNQINNRMTRSQLAALAPQLNWTNLLGELGLSEIPTVIAQQPSAIAAISRMLGEIPIEPWKDWMIARFLDDHAPFLPAGFDQANFEFRSRVLRGVARQRDRSQRGVALLNQWMGEAMGEVYVRHYLTPSAREQVRQIAENIRAAFRERLQHLSWMDTATRDEALSKLAAMEIRIGHPDRFTDYSAIWISRDDVLGNVIRAKSFDWQQQLARLTLPVDRQTWAIYPHAVAAFYETQRNQMTVAAGELLPPFFDPDRDAAANYGAIGATIGHEICHGFDNQGRGFDGSGRLRDWWTEASARSFQQRTANLGAQYDSYEPLPGLRINGRQTMAENIADLGGLEIAYTAYRRHVAQHGAAPIIDGLTGDQRFFLAYAQSWRGHLREQVLRQRLTTNSHSPPEFRVNGVVRNVDAWYRAFDVRPRDRLYLPLRQRVRIW